MKILINLLISLSLLMASVSVSHGKYRYDTNFTKLWNSKTSTSANDIQTEIDRNTLYRKLMSEMGVLFAPSFMAPAETLGYMGFALDLMYGVSTISANEDYWKNGVDGTPSSVVQTMGLQFRKGMWLPLPGFEIGGGVKYLLQSHMYAPYVFAKLALAEGYFKWPLPALAVRGHGIRVMGSTDVDITIASVDVSISKSFGIQSTINLTPYAGYNALMIISDSRVIIGQKWVDGNSTYGDVIFDDQDTIIRHRVFFGARLNYYKFVFTLEGVFSLAGTSTDEVIVNASTNATQQIKDASKLQQTYTLSIGWDW